MKFQTGKSYLMNWITSSNKMRWTVTKRTKSTLWIISQNGQEEKRRIKTMKDSGHEYVEPFGKYSMSPILKAENIISNKDETKIDVTDTNYEDELMPDNSQYKDDSEWQPYRSFWR